MFFILEISFILLVLCSLNKERFIHSWIKAAMVWCGLLFIHIEIFSIFYILNKYTILAFWMVICILEIIFLIRTRKYLFIDRILKYLIMVTKNNKFLTIVFGMVLLLALFTIPYNWDSMTYHIPRILHWVQNQSVNHYPTHIIRQIATPPFHEFICLDIYILSGNRDIFFNFVQCAAFMTNAWIIYEISIKLGCTKIFSKIGVLLFCSMPIAFAEALTTQNDNLCCMFLLIFLYYLLDFLHKTKKIEDSKENYTKCVIMASCIGFGYLTKPTVTMAMAFLVIVLVAFCIIRRDSLKTIIKLIFMVLPIILAIVLPEMLKNIGTFGAILPPETGSRQLIGTLNPKYVFVNFLKNFCFNLPNIYFINSHIYLANFVYKVAQLLSVDINAPCISEDGRSFFLHQAPSLAHDTAVSSTIFVFAIICFIWCIYRKNKVESYPKRYTYIVMSMFILECMFVRWEPFVSRYMLPYLALMCPMVSVWVEDISKNAKKVWLKKSIAAVACWLGIVGIIMLISYHGRIIEQQDFSRPEGYFTNRQDICEEYINTIDVVKNNIGVEQIGLITTADSYEYPIQYMLKYSAKRVEHVLVNNSTCKYEDISFIPDCILTIKDMGENLQVHGQTYVKLVSSTNINVYGIQLD